MAHTPLGEVCVAVGLMRREDVDVVLARVRTGERARFGEAAVEMGLLDEEGLARALAHQFRLNMVPTERLLRLHVGPEVVSLLPAGLMRERVLVPTFMDEEKRVLSLLTADPTDIPSLRAAQTAARAARLRLFVAPRSGLRTLIDRLLPVEIDDGVQHATGPRDVADGGGTTRTLVYEPDAEIAAALRRLEATEGVGTEIVGDPEQVSAFLEANQADRLFFRKQVAESAAPYLVAWRRLRPALRTCGVDGWGTARRALVDWESAREFVWDVLLRPIEPGAAERQYVAALARRMAAHLALPDDTVDQVAFTALLLGDRRPPVDGPWAVAATMAATERRSSGEQTPGADMAPEVVFTARAAARARANAPTVLEALGPEAARHDGAALRALAAVADAGGLPEPLQVPIPAPNPPPPADGALVSGELRALPLLDLVQAFSLAGRTAEVRVSGRGGPAGLQLRGGRLVAAWDGRAEGEAAFLALASTDEGQFEVRFTDVARANIGASTEFLLFEGARRRDERRILG